MISLRAHVAIMPAAAGQGRRRRPCRRRRATGIRWCRDRARRRRPRARETHDRRSSRYQWVRFSVSITEKSCPPASLLGVVATAAHLWRISARCRRARPMLVRLAPAAAMVATQPSIIQALRSRRLRERRRRRAHDRRQVRACLFSTWWCVRPANAPPRHTLGRACGRAFHSATRC